MTLRLARLFEAVVGLDPDAEMLASAARAAAGPGVGNAAWVRMRAEDLPAGLGCFRVVTFAASFTVRVTDQRVLERSADEVVAAVFSSSSTVPHLFGDRRADYERDMREILARASPSARFCVRLPDNILRIWRRPALPAPAGPSRCGRHSGGCA